MRDASLITTRLLGYALSVLLLVSGLPASSEAQENAANSVKVPEQPDVSRAVSIANSLSGIVVSESGSPLAEVTVVARQIDAIASFHAAQTGTEGRFTIDGLAPGSYAVYAQLPGYVPIREPGETATKVTYRPGESIRLTLKKGSVITGRVMNDRREPIVMINVRAIRIKDLAGNKVANTYAERQTDDRGVYRIFGLEPGTYLIQAGGGRAVSYPHQAPTFYVSDTRNTAQEVTLSDSEVSNIDVLWRNEAGHSVSGELIGSMSTASQASFTLFFSGTDTSVAEALVRVDAANNSFVLSGIPDGQYDLFVISSSSPPGFIARKSVRVLGADITNLKITVEPLSSIRGRAQIESAGFDSDECKSVRASASAAFLTVRADRDARENGSWSRVASGGNATINAKGDFEIQRLRSGAYYLTVDLTSETGLYLKAIQTSTPSKTHNQKGGDAGNKDGTLQLKPGEPAPMVALLGSGAALLRGTLDLVPNAKRPADLRLYLIPEERDAEVHRYRETLINADGSFEITNIFPGRYFVLTTSAAEILSGVESPPRFAAWDARTRSKLRELAQTTAQFLDLKRCQQLTDFQLHYR